jgi:hypothetical protein
LLVAFVAGAAAADEYKFPNGVSFTYPSGYQASETKQPPSVAVTLMNPSDPMMTFVVSVTEGAGDGVIPDGELNDEEIKKTMPEGTKLLAYKKITVGGNRAILVETSTENSGMTIFSRGVTVVSGNNVVSVAAAIMDNSKVDAGRKIADDIMNSVKF